MQSTLGVLVAALALLSSKAFGACQNDFGNSTFNLKALENANGWVVMDGRANSWSNNYTYYFNLCNNIDRSPSRDPACPSPSSSDCCAVTAGHDRYNSGPAPAFQVANPSSSWVPGKNDSCHRLGANLKTSPEDMAWQLFDSTDPTKGVTLTYSGGDGCGASVGSRSLSIHMLCSESQDTLGPDPEEVIMETDSCFYEITFVTPFGCPLECPFTNGQLCSHHGICAYDTALSRPRCFCNDGFDGNDCASKINITSRGLSTLGVLLIVIAVFIAILLAFLYFLWTKIRSLRLDPQAYKRLTGGPGETIESGIYDE